MQFCLCIAVQTLTTYMHPGQSNVHLHKRTKLHTSPDAHANVRVHACSCTCTWGERGGAYSFVVKGVELAVGILLGANWVPVNLPARERVLRARRRQRSGRPCLCAAASARRPGERASCGAPLGETASMFGHAKWIVHGWPGLALENLAGSSH